MVDGRFQRIIWRFIQNFYNRLRENPIVSYVAYPILILSQMNVRMNLQTNVRMNTSCFFIKWPIENQKEKQLETAS